MIQFIVGLIVGVALTIFALGVWAVIEEDEHGE